MEKKPEQEKTTIAVDPMEANAIDPVVEAVSDTAVAAQEEACKDEKAEEADNSRLLITGASAAGANHKMADAPGHINNQDAFELIARFGQTIGGVICDGCTALPYSEIGARFGAVQIAKLIEEQILYDENINWRYIQEQLLRQIEQIAQAYHRPSVRWEKTLQDYFSFTILVGLVIGDDFVVASCGDGVFLVDDELFSIKNPSLQPKKKGDELLTNAPPYIVYNLIPSRYDHQFNELLELREIFRKPLVEIKKTMLVGSDGIKPLIEARMDYIHHPNLISESFRLQQWFDSEVRRQETVYLPDDITALIIRTPKMQEKLKQERNEIAYWKGELSKSNKSVSALKKQVASLKATLVEKERLVNLYKPKPYVAPFKKLANQLSGKKPAGSPYPNIYTETVWDNWEERFDGNQEASPIVDFTKPTGTSHSIKVNVDPIVDKTKKIIKEK